MERIDGAFENPSIPEDPKGEIIDLEHENFKTLMDEGNDLDEALGE